MGRIYYADGRQEERAPANGQDYSLEEMQAIVGGYIETVPCKQPGMMMVVNEEGKLLGLPRNDKATALAALPTSADLAALRLMWGDDVILIGDHPLDSEAEDYIAGDVLVCENKQVR